MKHEDDGSSTSLLDLLSNTLGAVLLLFMIIAGINALTRIHTPEPKREGSPGPMATLVDLKPMKTDTPPDVVIAQIVLRGADGGVRLIAESGTDSCEIFESADGDVSHWLVVKTETTGKCQVLIDYATAGIVEAVALVTRGDYILPLLGPTDLHRVNHAGRPIVMTICKSSRDGTGVVLGRSC